MSSPEPCNCETSLALAAELAMARARLAAIAKLVRELRDMDDGRNGFPVECVDQLGEVLAEGWLP